MSIIKFIQKSHPWLPCTLSLGLAMAAAGCSDHGKEKPKIYHIIGEKKTPASQDPIDPTEPPPPPTPFYGNINLILLGKSDVYLHRVFPIAFFDQDSYIRPMELALTKWDIKKIELTDLPLFLTEEFKSFSKDRYRQYGVCLKSSSDTITNEAFPVIDDFLKSIHYGEYIIRQWTPQEKEAIESLNR